MGGSKVDGRVAASGKRRWIWRLLPFAAAVLGGAALLLPSGATGLSATCAIISNFGLQVTITGPGTVTVSRDVGSGVLAGPAIRVNGTACGTTTTVDKILVNGDSAAQSVVFDLTNGRFEPGRSTETGTREIETEISGIEGLSVIGSSTADT